MAPEVNVFLLPREFEPNDLSGRVAVVIDVLRATTTIVTALASGARCVIPCGDVEDARRIASEYSAGEVLLGGERGGVRIEGFDLDNSPSAYSTDRVAGKTVIFTTTNGTAALLRAQQADRVLLGSLVNRRALVRELLADSGPVNLVCAGTEGFITAEDVLAAGAIASELDAVAGGTTSSADTALIARELWTSCESSKERLRSVLRQSRGGRNLVALGFDADIEFAARVDAIPLVAEYFPATGDVRAVR
jgi:2-phosphosulfolactate phosphatase